MQIYIHQTHHTIADFNEIFLYLKDLSQQDYFEDNIHIFPELFLCGYPLADLCLQKDFITNYHVFFEELKNWWNELAKNLKPTALLLGGLEYIFDDFGNPSKIENSIFELSINSKKKIICLDNLYSKRLLPSYDIFDEAKYYTPGKEARIWSFESLNFGLLICEDMWSSVQYDVDPVVDLLNLCSGKKINAVINLSASPFHVGKETSRIARVREISKAFKTPFFYVNKVGAEDEILFDGASFVFSDEKVVAKALSFQKDIIHYKIDEAKLVNNEYLPTKLEHSWESLFAPRLEENEFKLKKLTDDECEQILHALNLGIGDYANKTGHKKFLVALSGGMDSVLVTTLLKMFLKPGQELEAIYMPSQFSQGLSWDISKELCSNLKIKLTSLPIKFLHATIKGQFRDSFTELEGLADENVQSRLRGMLLYTRSNQSGSMVLNTSNKSEIAVGYSTQYGDSVGAISPLGDLYKSEVYDLAKYINKKYGTLIPDLAIQRPPSAELRENQSDNQSLPEYEILDTLLEAQLSYRYSKQDLIDAGFEQVVIEKIYRLCNLSEYKRKQFCPIIKLKSKSFGFGRRMPITKKI